MSAPRRGGGSSRLEKERDKLIQERLQVLLSTLLRDDDNKYCVDCDAKGPRWASWNLGLFLCIRCAGIHRNLGVHISKVKSVNLDSWTPTQVASMQAMGNSRARAVFEANLPEDFRRPQTESSLETFIRAKYEKKKYIAKEWVPSKPPDFPEGWTQLIEAEKQKKDIKQIRLPSHTLPPPPQQSNSSSNNVSPNPTPRPSIVASNSSAQDLLALSTSTVKSNALVNTQPSAPSNVDLIGIVDSTPQDNNFDAFAPTVKADPQSPSNDLKKSEDDFFNSPVTNSSKSSSDKKLSNDSIMALFSQSGNANSPNAFGNPQNFMQNFNSQPSGHANAFGQGFNMTSNNQNGVNPFMAPGSINPMASQDVGANQVMNQFNGLNLGAPNGTTTTTTNGMGNLLNHPPPPSKTDTLANLDMWSGF